MIIIDVDLHEDSVSIIKNNDALEATYTVGWSFTSELQTVVFDDLSFGLTYFVDSEEVLKTSHPKPGILYESTDQTFIEIDQLPVIPGAECALEVIVNEGGRELTQVFNWMASEYLPQDHKSPTNGDTVIN